MKKLCLKWISRAGFDNGYDEKMGARPMQRLIQDEIKQKLAESILFGDRLKRVEYKSISEERKIRYKVLSPQKKELTT